MLSFSLKFFISLFLLPLNNLFIDFTSQSQPLPPPCYPPTSCWLELSLYLEVFIYSFTVSPPHTQHTNLIEKRSREAKAQDWEDVTKGKMSGGCHWGFKNMAAEAWAWPRRLQGLLQHLLCPHLSSWLSSAPSTPSLLCLQLTSCRARPFSLTEPCFSAMCSLNNSVTKLAFWSGSVSGEGVVSLSYT